MVYTTNEGGVKLVFGDWKNQKESESCVAYVEAGQWTRLVFEKRADGRFYLRGGTGGATTTDMFGGDRNANQNESNLNVHGIRIQSMTGNVGDFDWTYLGGYYACNELPQIPAGMLDWGV